MSRSGVATMCRSPSSAEDFARFLYLPRLKGPEVLLRSIDDGVSLITWEQETFAFAESFDEDAGRYRALRFQDRINLPDASAPGLLVKPAVARGCDRNLWQGVERPPSR